jgi:glycosyltransferase involved in cell wall biosynthesis
VKLGLVVLGGVPPGPAVGRIPCIQWLIERLARRHTVHVFSMHGAPRPARYGLLGATVHHAGARPIGLRTFAAIVAEHRRGPFDLFHAFWVVPSGAIAALAGRILRRPVLVHAAGGELVAIGDIGYGGLRTWPGRVAARFALRGAARITAASQPMLDAVAAMGYAAERVPLGVDLQRWPVVAPRSRRAGATARLLHLASLNRVKDQTTLLDAAQQLRNEGLDFRLDVVGQDTLGGAMQAYAQRLGLSDRVRFHGYVLHEELHDLVAGADILWISSRHEAGPIAVLEAAIVGVPTVGTAVGHIAEWAPEAAIAVPVGDGEALARETLALLRHDDRRLSVAREAQRRATAFDADWTAERFEALYRKVAPRPRGELGAGAPVNAATPRDRAR